MNPFAKILFEIEAVKLSPTKPFHYASGLKGPIYCDNRTLLTRTSERKKIIDGLIELSQSKNYHCIAGLATAGIAHASMMALILDKPLCYIRSKPKDHGRGNQVEGNPPMGAELLLIEDLVNQASSLADAVKGARLAGFVVNDCLSIVDYETKASRQVLQDLDITLTSLVTFSDLIETALELQSISSADILTLREWHYDPKSWSNRFS